MLTKQKVSPREISPIELAMQRKHPDATRVADSLSAGLTLLRDLLLTRLHEDVERQMGIDPLLAPGSQREEQKQIQNAKVEIEIYMNIVASEEATQSGYVRHAEAQLSEWLFRLRMDHEQEALFRRRIQQYASPSVEARRIKFLALIERTIPESVRTPLVLFRLFPRAVRIATAVAFADPLRAQELRAEQCSFLPAIGDCFECHGRVLDNEETCPVCGNPVWEFSWLQAD